MTREEAIERFENVKANALAQKASGVSEYWQNEIDGTIEALDMAIEALSQPIVAKHFDIQSGYIYCSPQIAENVKVVVRCKDCEYYKKITEKCDHGLCHRDIVASVWGENGYCSRAKMKGAKE